MVEPLMQDILKPPAEAEQSLLQHQLRTMLDSLGVDCSSSLLRMVVVNMCMLTPELSVEAVRPFLLQTLWIYLTDAVIDSSQQPQVLEPRLRAWCVYPAPERVEDPLHRLLLALRAEVASSQAPDVLAVWWEQVTHFIEAQLFQRHQPAASYLDYLTTRILAQGVSLTVYLAAALRGAASFLSTAHTARLLWWLGCYYGLTNDLTSYEREIEEGVASTANGIGILVALGASHPPPLLPQQAAVLARKDADVAWERLLAELGPPKRWNQVDMFIARLSILLREGHAS